MKQIIFVILGLLIAIPAFSQADLQPAATVNLIRTEPITVRQLRIEVERMERATSRTLTQAERLQILDVMINERLVLQAAERDRITVSENELNQQIQQLRAGLAQQLGRQPTDAEFAQAVMNESGMDVPTFRDNLRKQMIMQKYLSHKKGDVLASLRVPTEAEILAEYNLAKSIYNLSNIDAKVLGLGVDTNTIGNAEKFREKYNIKSDFIIYAGRKDAAKNVDMLINYYSAYKYRNPVDLKMVLIGGGDAGIPKYLKEEIIDLGFVSVQDKYDACAAASLLCQPSVNESFSFVIMESWLCGRPVMVHDKCPVTKEFVIKSNGGLYFGNYLEFEGCLNYLISNPEQADIMGKLGRKFVMDNFNWDVIVKRYTEYFKEVSV